MVRLLLYIIVSLSIQAEVAAQIVTNPPVVSTDVRVALARLQTYEFMSTPLCRKAFRERFHVEPNEDFFSGKYTIGIMNGLLPNGARGATSCTASHTNMILSGFWVNLGDTDQLAETLIHEYWHLLQCQNDPPLPDSEPMLSKRMEGVEREAYAVTAICVGENPSKVINQWGVVPKGFEEWQK